MSSSAAFWGPVTSSHDWCEANYVYTNYIAEFWNTISSIPISAFGVFGMWITFNSPQKTFRWSFILAYFGLFIIGLGSALFHATLLFEAQMADEFPMILASLVYAYIVLDVQFVTWKRTMSRAMHAAIVLALTTFACGMAYVMLSDSSTHLPFIIVYCGVVGYICIGSLDVVLSLKNQTATRWFWISCLVYLIGAVVWLTERHMCGQFFAPLQYFHAVWHLCAGYGTFSILMCVFYMNQISQQSVTKKLLTTNSFGVPFVDFIGVHNA